MIGLKLMGKGGKKQLVRLGVYYFYLLLVWGSFRYWIRLPEVVEELWFKPVIWLLPLYWWRISLKGKPELFSGKKVLDDKNLSLYVGSDSSAQLQKPFSKSQLFLALENLLDSVSENHKNLELPKDTQEIKELDILEKRIVMLTKEYQDNIIKAIRAFHEK